MTVPSNLVPISISGLPTPPTPVVGTDLVMIVQNGTSYRTTISDFVGSVATPNTTKIIAGTGLIGGGNLGSNVTLAIGNTGVSSGTYGSSTQVPVLTINAQGQVTNVSSTTFSVPFSGITGKPTTLAGYGITDAQPLSNNLTGLAGLGTSGLIVNQTGGSYVSRSIAAGAGLTVTNGDGVSGNPTIAMPNQSVTPGTYGSPSAIPVITVDQQGRIATIGTISSLTGGTVTQINTGTGLTGGPITVSGTVSIDVTGVTASSYGSASAVPIFTVNAQGQLTVASNTPISIPSSAINTAIPNASLANSSITINGNSVSLGGSTTVTASTTGTLTLGTGLSGTSFNGSTNVTAAIANTTVTAGIYGSSTAIPTFTVNAQGQLTVASTAVVIAPAGTLSGTTLNSTVVSSSLTSVGTIGTGVWQGSTIAVAYGGTGVTTSTGSGSNVLSNSPTLVTPILGTPTSVTLTNATGLPLTTGVTGTLPIANGGTGITSFGTGVQTALGQAVTGSGGIALSTSPTFVTPTLGAASATSVAMTTGTISTTPSGGTDIVNKSYVDSVVSGNNYHAACNYATTADLGSVTYNNGTSGVGATITKTSPFATLSIDGANPSVGQRILVKNETSGQYNGIYTVTSVGSGAAGWVLTRATDYNTTGTGANQIAPGDTTFIISGTANANTQWTQTTDLPITIGTTPIVFVQIGASTNYSAGTGLTLAGTTFSITNTTVTASSYGSSTAIPTFTVNAQGQLTLASTAAVIAPAGTLTGTTLASNVVSSSLTSVGTIGTGTWQGTAIGATYGGTGQTSYTIGDLLYASSTTALSKLTDVATGSVLVSGGIGVAPSYSSSPTLSGTTTSAYFIANGSISGSTSAGAVSYGSLAFSDNNIVASFSSTVNSYNQMVLQNTSTGSAASTNFIVANGSGTSTAFYGEFGMNSSGFTGSGSLNLPNAVYLDATSGDLVLGTTTSNAVHFVVNSGTTDAMTISAAGTTTIATLNLTNALGPTYGGTGQTSYATGDLLYASATNTLSKLTAGTNGYVLTLSGGVPTWAAASSGVSSISFGSTGLTPSTATTGAVTVAGTLALANGGTGATTVSAAQTNLQVDPAGTAVAMSIALG